MATSTHGNEGHGHGAATRLHEDLPHYSEFHTKHPPISLFHITALSLAGLLVVTVLLYDLDFEKATHIIGLNLIIALCVAVDKAFLVVRNFMNLRGGTKLTVLWASLGFIWLLLMGGIFMDYRTRPEAPGWQKMEYTVQNVSPNTVKEMAPEQVPANP